MDLNTYIKNEKMTDASFGKRIGTTRLQVLKYRHKTQIPGKKRMQKIVKATQGQVTPASFYE